MPTTKIAVSLFLAAALAGAVPGWAQHAGHDAAAPAAASPARSPIRMTMDALHQHGGVPPGWKFEMPAGDPAKGRQVFVALECFACHDVKGEDFPRQSTRERGQGPELTGMGGHHPAEYFAESIVNPNRVIVVAPGFTGADGLSKMPDYSDAMTLRQLVDLVAYLSSLTPAHGGHTGHDMRMERGAPATKKR